MQNLSRLATLILVIIMVLGIGSSSAFAQEGSTSPISTTPSTSFVDNIAVTCQNNTASIVMTGTIPDGDIMTAYSFAQQGTASVASFVNSVNYAAGVASLEVELPAGGVWEYIIQADWYWYPSGNKSVQGTCGTAAAAAPDFAYPDRLNARDIAAPVAIFPVSFEGGTGLVFYAIGADNAGILALVVTPEQIAAVAAEPAVNTLIAATEDGSIALYRLTTGELQVVMGDYVVIFSDLVVDTPVTH